ncbi:uncharacterized protein TM35_000045260 [Trypanosoma theileri]|uniref:Uncharacterized protein n=1 Tax=Trypanosoma theileri TaxID=67003 RepID=A0A1X0P5V6_9TRYP|nr:uncharacterized protein TM35_000045260 [Trypanosoma theileri]ORC92312.1 hypothetical protein TM35_000045260 [Trypanosoma theileri]
MISTLGTWDEGIRAFLKNVSQKGPEPWDMSYEERRRLTLEPRVLRQLELEDEWKETCMEGIWNGMRRFARPMEDYKLSESRFYEYLLSIGISSEYLKIRLFQLFRVEPSAEIDCLRVCKALYMGLTDEGTSSNFLTHCYKSLPCSPLTSEVDRSAVLKAYEQQQQQRLTKEQKNSADLRKQQLEGVLSFYEDTDGVVFDIDAFKSLFFEAGWHLWASSFVKQIFEAAAKYFNSPYGSFPVIPLRWTKMAEPLPYSRDVVYDADSLLLQNIELTGKDNIDMKQKGKKRRGRKSQKK